MITASGQLVGGSFVGEELNYQDVHIFLSSGAFVVYSMVCLAAVWLAWRIPGTRILSFMDG